MDSGPRVSVSPPWMIGDHKQYNRKSLKGYVAEGKLKRIIQNNQREIEEYLKSRYRIQRTRVDEMPEGLYRIEQYRSSELLQYKLAHLSPELCIILLEIYEENNILAVVDKIQEVSPL